MKTLLKKSVCAGLVLVAMSNQALAQRGGGGSHSGAGNGGDDPAVAYKKDELKEVKINTSLDYLKLTPAEIKKRDKALAPIYKFYQQATVAKVSQKIEEQFGISVYHYAADSVYTPHLNDKKGTMDSIIRYYFGIDNSPFKNASPDAVPFPKIMWQAFQANFDRNYGPSSYPQLSAQLIEGDKEHFRSSAEFYSPSKIGTFGSTTTKYSLLDLIETHPKGLFTNTTSRVFELPVLDDLMSAMGEANLRALDATVVFLNYKLKDKPYQVIYPQNSKLAPIPTPVIFVSSEATRFDLIDMIEKEAPQIYAYNQLLTKNLLPSIDEMEKTLRKYPELLDQVKKAKGEVKRENIRAALQQAYLTVAYSMLAVAVAPVALAAAMASPVIAPVIIAQTVIFIY